MTTTTTPEYSIHARTFGAGWTETITMVRPLSRREVASLYARLPKGLRSYIHTQIGSIDLSVEEIAGRMLGASMADQCHYVVRLWNTIDADGSCDPLHGFVCLYPQPLDPFPLDFKS